MPFEEFLRTQIFEPLGMVDTAFSVPNDKADRYATLYEPTEDGWHSGNGERACFKWTAEFLPLSVVPGYNRLPPIISVSAKCY